MRQIKFRAWCLDNKWMEDHFFIQSNGVVHDVPSKTYDTPHTEIEENPNLILMQFTGLQDKNGVDIYEGDIVKFSYDFDDDFIIYEVKYGSYGHSSTVGFHCFSVDDKEIYDYYGGMPDVEELKVIGNIHSNPELLEQ